MNRLVIVGNGFDLAHGLPTGYCDFIDWFWSNLHAKYESAEYKQIVYIDDMHSEFLTNYGIITNYNDIRRCLGNHAKENGHLYDSWKIISTTQDWKIIFRFNSNFFKIICESNSIQNWVDIENEYYELLKECLHEDNSKRVRSLNSDFESVKKLFESYMNEKIQEYDFAKISNNYGFSEIFKIPIRFIESNTYNDYLKEFPQSDHNDLITFDNSFSKALESNLSSEILKEITCLKKNVFINFNYTPTVKTHIKNFIDSDVDYYGENKVIHIHGKLKDKENPINFGFGDEMDNHYKLIEEKDDNEYLKNIKSFQYLQNSNYKDLLDFIDSEKFQVYIMGHSCGLSDRILLNTIFEHEHCRSIKVFYHEKDGKDNYTDIVQNISRHFNKKKMMRDKLVNKSLCQPLPQNIRFAEKK